MGITYKNLYSLVDDTITKRLNYINNSNYSSQLARNSVSPITTSSTGDVAIADLVSSIQDLLSVIVTPHIISGLTVEATDPISSSVIVKAGKGVANGSLYTLEEDTTIAIPLNSGVKIYYISLYLDTICLETNELPNKLTVAKIIIPNTRLSSLIQDTKDESWNAYIQNYKVYDLYGDNNGKFEEDTVELLRDNFGQLLADNLVGNLRLSENLKIINTQGTLELDSNQMLLKDFDENTLAKFNQNGIYFYNAHGIELAKFSSTEARIGNIVITTNTLESDNFVAGSSGFQIKDDGNVEFNDMEIRGTIYATAGEIGGWTIAEEEIYATDTGTIKTSSTAGEGYNGVVIDKDGIRVYDDILGCVVNLPSDGSAPTFSSGEITSVTWELDTISVIRTSETVGDGSASSAGILINNTGIYGCGVEQTLSEANLKILATGDIYLRGEIQAISGTIGGFTIDSNQLTGGTIVGAIVRGSIIENADSLPRIRIDEEGIYYQVLETVGKYGELTYDGVSGEEAYHYGAGVVAYLFNENYPPLSILAEQGLADIRLYNRSENPGDGTGPHEVGDLICVSGKLKMCTSAGSPGTFSTVSANPLDVDLDFDEHEAVAMVLENRIDDPVDPAIGRIWIRID